MSEAGERAPLVFVKRVYCRECGAEARQWRTTSGDVRLPSNLPMDEVRRYLNGGFTRFMHPQHKGSIFAELEPVQ